MGVWGRNVPQKVIASFLPLNFSLYLTVSNPTSLVVCDICMIMIVISLLCDVFV